MNPIWLNRCSSVVLWVWVVFLGEDTPLDPEEDIVEEGGGGWYE